MLEADTQVQEAEIGIGKEKMVSEQLKSESLLTLLLDDVQVRPVLHPLPVGGRAVHLGMLLPLVLHLHLQPPDLGQQLFLLLRLLA